MRPASSWHRSRLRYAARRSVERKLRATDEEAGSQSVPGAGRVDDRGVACRQFHSLLTEDEQPARPALDDCRRREPVRGTDDLPLGLVRKDHVGLELLEQLAETHRTVLANAGPGGEIDAHSCAVSARELGGLERSSVDRRRQQCVPGDVKTVAREPRLLEVGGRELGRDATIRRHRALTVCSDEGDDDAVPAANRPGDLDSPCVELRRHELTRKVIASLRDGSRL